MPLLQRWEETIHRYPYKIDIVHERYRYGEVATAPQELVSTGTLLRCTSVGNGHLSHVYMTTWEGSRWVQSHTVRQPMEAQCDLAACDTAQTYARAQVMQTMYTLMGDV